jgi:hypothetical protein
MTCPIPVTAPGHAGIPDPELADEPISNQQAGPRPALPAGSDPAMIGPHANQERRKP